MKSNTRNAVSLIVCLLTLFAFPRQAFSATNHITSCGTNVTTSGLWVVDNDLTCTGNGINVQIGNVTLKLQGHTLTGPSASDTSIGVWVATASSLGVKNVTILGPGKITNFGHGIVFSATVGGGAVGVQFVSNGSGVYLGNDNSATGVSTSLLISQNIMQSNAWGIVLEGATKDTIVGNNISSSSIAGIDVVDGTSSSFLGNISNGNNGDGIAIGNPSGAIVAVGNTFEGNITNSNSLVGIHVYSASSGSHFSGNVASSNGVLDISEAHTGCATDTYKSEVFATANLTCVK